jgi:hypothetical protein
MAKQQSLDPNPLQLPLVRGRAKAAPPAKSFCSGTGLTRGGWEGFMFPAHALPRVCGAYFAQGERCNELCNAQ